MDTDPEGSKIILMNRGGKEGGEQGGGGRERKGEGGEIGRAHV